jgi:very-short-patch-repair endonuclease
VREIPSIARRQCGVFSAAQAASSGWTQSALRWAVRSGHLDRPRAGVFQVADLGCLDIDEGTQRRWRHAAPAIAASLTTPGAQASHSTAAVLHGLPHAFLPELPCVSVVPWHTGEIRHVHVHRTTAAPLTLPVGAVPCTSIARTVVDLAREHGPTAGTVPLDFALRRGLVTAADLADVLAHCRGWPGVRDARAAIDAADARSESPLESLSRMKFPRFDLPMPQLQTSVGDHVGRFIGRVDFYWDRFGVVGEADGLQKYDDEDSDPLRAEKLRQEHLEDTGLIVVRWSQKDLPTFEEVAGRLRRAFRRGAQRSADDRRWILLARFDPAMVARAGPQRR